MRLLDSAMSRPRLSAPSRASAPFTESSTVAKAGRLAAAALPPKSALSAFAAIRPTRLLAGPLPSMDCACSAEIGPASAKGSGSEKDPGVISRPRVATRVSKPSSAPSSPAKSSVLPPSLRGTRAIAAATSGRATPWLSCEAIRLCPL